MRKLLPYQRKAMAEIRHRDLLALFWEMRLGKTLMAIRWAERRGANYILVVAPMSVLHVWESELALEGHDARSLRGQIASQIDDGMPIPGRGWYLINYDYLRSRDWLCQQDWDCVILDESPAIRNPRTKTSKVIANSFRNVPKKAILTGCPTPNSLLDLFQQFKFLDDELMGCRSYWQFRKKTHYPTRFRWHPKRGMKDEIKREVASISHVLRRQDAGIGSRTVVVPRFVDMPKSARRAYEKAEKDFCLEGVQGNGREVETKWKIVVDQWLARISGGTHKDRELLGLLKGELAEEQVVVWFRYNAELLRIADTFKKHHIKYAIVKGSVHYDERGRIAKRFRDGKFRVLMCQTACAKYGQDYSAADTAIYFSSGYSWETRVQSMDRIVHPKKKTPLLIIDLITRNSIDEDIRKALQRKKATSSIIMRAAIKEMFQRVKLAKKCSNE